MDPASVRANITERTKALIVTNLWGLCAELDEIARTCSEHRIFMIEDCAHNMGSTWKGRHAGTYGDLGVFSFQQGKHLPTGDGGIMVTDREGLCPTAEELIPRIINAPVLEVPPETMRRNVESFARAIRAMG